MKNLLIGLWSLLCCGWSALTYLPPWGRMPEDKPSYWANWLGFTEGDLYSAPFALAIARYKEAPSFHHAKDVLVEWCRAWPQRAAKLLALLILGLVALLAAAASTAFVAVLLAIRACT